MEAVVSEKLARLTGQSVSSESQFMTVLFRIMVKVARGVYNLAKLIFEAFVGEHLPARCRIRDNRHRAIFSGTSTFLASN